VSCEPELIVRGLDPKLVDFRAPTPLFACPLTRQIVVVDSVPNLGAVEYGFVIVAAGIAAGLVLVTRARRRDNAIAMNYARTSAASVAHSTQACELSASLTGP
jgi:hypothetical protein